MLGFIAWVKDWIASRDLARSTSAAPDLRAAPQRRAQACSERRLGQAQMRLAQARADWRAAEETWPRDRKAIGRTWRQFRAAKCAQLSAEIGR